MLRLCRIWEVPKIYVPILVLLTIRCRNLVCNKKVPIIWGTTHLEFVQGSGTTLAVEAHLSYSLNSLKRVIYIYRRLL